MNEHIELVEKWLEDNNSVSLEELEATADAAHADATHAARAAHAGRAAYSAVNRAAAAKRAADAADAADYAEAATDAAYWVGRYEEITNDK